MVVTQPAPHFGTIQPEFLTAAHFLQERQTMHESVPFPTIRRRTPDLLDKCKHISRRNNRPEEIKQDFALHNLFAQPRQKTLQDLLMVKSQAWAPFHRMKCRF